MVTETVKNAIEIGTLVSQLTPVNQAYVMNTINALLYSQQIEKEQREKKGECA